MARRKVWADLSEPYRRRLTRSLGPNPQAAYESGASIRAARGHKATPERPSQAFKRPDIFRAYLVRAERRGVELPPNLLTQPVRGGFTDRATWRNRETLQKAVIFRTRGGTLAGDPGTIVIMEADHETGEWSIVETRNYNQADFHAIVRELKADGVDTEFESQPTRGVTA